MKTLIAAMFALAASAGTAHADVDVVRGIGRTRLDACIDAKQTARNVTLPYNFIITRYGPCDCEPTHTGWSCMVEFRYHHRK